MLVVIKLGSLFPGWGCVIGNLTIMKRTTKPSDLIPHWLHISIPGSTVCRIVFMFCVLYPVIKGGVSAAALESYGPGLVAHSVAKWFTENKIPADFIAQMPSDPHNLPEGGKWPLDLSTVCWPIVRIILFIFGDLHFNLVILHMTIVASTLYSMRDTLNQWDVW